MEEVQSPNTVPPVETPRKNKTIMMLAIGIVIGVLVGFGVRSFMPGNAPKNIASQNVPVTSASPTPPLLADPTNILTSPVINEWGGSVQGVVVSKTENSFTVEKDGSRLEIFLQTPLSGFFREQTDPNELPERITFEEVLVGDSVLGGVVIVRQSTDLNQARNVLANVFTVKSQEIQN